MNMNLLNQPQYTHYILSNCLKHSKTFQLYKTIFNKLKMNHQYLPLEFRTKNNYFLTLEEKKAVQQLIDSLKKQKNFQSIVISSPFKQELLPFISNLDKTASKIGAINLILKNNNTMLGMNLDGDAFWLGLSNTLPINICNKKALVLGAGGVSGAVSYKLAEKNIKALDIFDIKIYKSKKLANQLSKYFKKTRIKTLDKLIDQNLSDYNIIYNGTGLGKYSDIERIYDKSPLPDKLRLKKGAIAIDANYTPLKTKFLLQCESRGLKIVNGFSHMIGFTTLHLNKILEKEISFNFVFKIGKQILETTSL